MGFTATAIRLYKVIFPNKEEGYILGINKKDAITRALWKHQGIFNLATPIDEFNAIIKKCSAIYIRNFKYEEECYR